jgi:rubrerythrin
MPDFNPSDRTCFPAADAPTVTGKVCICQVCGTQWAMRGESDDKGCSFCNAPASAITVVSEEPDYGGGLVR